MLPLLDEMKPHGLRKSIIGRSTPQSQAVTGRRFRYSRSALAVAESGHLHDALRNWVWLLSQARWFHDEVVCAPKLSQCFGVPRQPPSAFVHLTRRRRRSPEKLPATNQLPRWKEKPPWYMSTAANARVAHPEWRLACPRIVTAQRGLEMGLEDAPP